MPKELHEQSKINCEGTPMNGTDRSLTPGFQNVTR